MTFEQCITVNHNASKASEVSCSEYKCHQIMDFLDVLLDYNF